jgi:hypothetical protein
MPMLSCVSLLCLAIIGTCRPVKNWDAWTKFQVVLLPVSSQQIENRTVGIRPLPQERTPAPTKQEARWAPKPVNTFWKREKSLTPTGIQRAGLHLRTLLLLRLIRAYPAVPKSYPYCSPAIPCLLGFRLCLSHLIYTVRPCRAMTMPFWKRLLKATAWHGMACVN